MRQQAWQLEEARNGLSQLVEQALTEGPQIITLHGVETVIGLSYKEYRRMLLNQHKLSSFFAESPLADLALDLHRDKRVWRQNVEL